MYMQLHVEAATFYHMDISKLHTINPLGCNRYKVDLLRSVSGSGLSQSSRRKLHLQKKLLKEVLEENPSSVAH